MKISVDYIMHLVLIAFHRIKHNKDVTIAIVGKKGNAKSTLMLYLGIHSAVLRKYYAKYHTLKINKEKLSHIKIDFEKDVLEYITWIPSRWLENMVKAPRFTVVGLDEAGNAWNNRRFNEEVNKILNETQQSNRFLGQIKVLTMPHLNDIDSGGRKNCNFYVDMFMQGKGKVYFLATDSYTGKQYRYAIRIGKKDYIISTVPLNKKLYDMYESQKRSTEVQRYLDRIAKLKEIEEKESRDSAFKRAVQTAIDLLETAQDKILTKTGKLKASYLAAKAGVSYQIAYKVKAIYEAEGLEGLQAL